MSNVIIFTDRAPVSLFPGGKHHRADFYTHSAGPHKLASHLRDKGFTVIVVPNSLRLSFAGVKKIIQQNSKDLLWVGISSTFFTVKSENKNFERYRHFWSTLESDTVEIDSLFHHHTTWNISTEMPWSTKEIEDIAAHLKSNYNVPMLIGGAWVSDVLNAAMSYVPDNTYLVRGYAERYVEEFSYQKLIDKNAIPPIVVDNNYYNDHDFKSSTIGWTPQDFIDEESWLPLEISRGCAFNCAFCNYERKATSDLYKNPQVLKDELMRNYDEYGVTRYILIDDLYNDSKVKVRELYDKVWSKLPFRVEWISYMRLDMIWADPDSANFIKESGARLGTFGIETLHNKAGKAVGKGLGPTRIKETLELLKESWQDHTLVDGLFIAGLPHEPKESIIDTIEWCKTTDLLHGYAFSPMWITPPLHKQHALRPNDISKDNKRYGITWAEDNQWTNQVGMSFKEATELAVAANKNISAGGLSVFGFAYADARRANLTHEQIANYKNIPDFAQLLENSQLVISDLIDKRLNKILNLPNIIR